VACYDTFSSSKRERPEEVLDTTPAPWVKVHKPKGSKTPAPDTTPEVAAPPKRKRPKPSPSPIAVVPPVVSRSGVGLPEAEVFKKPRKPRKAPRKQPDLPLSSPAAATTLAALASPSVEPSATEGPSAALPAVALGTDQGSHRAQDPPVQPATAASHGPLVVTRIMWLSS
jgi:hypothetical protein